MEKHSFSYLSVKKGSESELREYFPFKCEIGQIELITNDLEKPSITILIVEDGLMDSTKCRFPSDKFEQTLPNETYRCYKHFKADKSIFVFINHWGNVDEVRFHLMSYEE